MEAKTEMDGFRIVRDVEGDIKTSLFAVGRVGDHLVASFQSKTPELGPTHVIVCYAETKKIKNYMI